MPSALTYPGVYVEEIPSGVRTITGVATSITAFMGRTARGSWNEPTTITSYGEYERQFGGLDIKYPLSYAVRDFYLNGGSRAIIVRLYVPPASADGKARLTVDDLKFVAASEGSWGNNLRVSADVDVPEEIRVKLGVPAAAILFNLTIIDKTPGGSSERFLNLTVVDSARRIDRVLTDQSSLIAWDGTWPPATLPALAKFKTAFTKLTALRVAQAATPPIQATIDTAQQAYDTAKTVLADAATKADVKLDAALHADPKVPADITAAQTDLTNALAAMKGDDGGPLVAKDYQGKQSDKSGIFALDKVDLFNLLCILPDTRGGNIPVPVYQDAMAYCAKHRAMLIVDPPVEWALKNETAAAKAVAGLGTLGLNGPDARNAALFFPRILQADPKLEGQIDVFVPCGIVAGVMARTDTQRGVWKAPAGLDASLVGTAGLQVNLNDAENGLLNPLAINCLRSFPVGGRVVWGSRTLRGADQLADEYKYIPVRRLALFIEESLYRGTQWVVFEPNDEPLWAQIRLNVGAFMHNLFHQGAFQGKTRNDAYFVKCDRETTTQNDINLGIVNIVVGFAPLKPAEFVVLKLQQIAGQIET